MVIGASTEVIAGEGRIVTAGGIDSHIHFICPQLVDEALSAGLTTLIGGGTGPATGTNATTCSSGAWNIHRMLEAAEGLPINLGFLAKGNASRQEPLREQVEAGAIGLKLHEDWGTTPAAIDNCLSVAEEMDIQVAIHTDTLNEAGFVEDSIRAFKGRTIHTYHTEGAGGGHAPDIMRVVGEANCLPSSTNPTMPFTVNTMDEHLDMLMVCHHLKPEDSRGPGLRGVAHPRRDHRRGRRAPRPGRHQHALVGLAGHGADRGGHHPDLADRAQDEAPARRAARRRARTTTTARSATWPSTPSIPPSPTASPTRWARSRRASWPTS